MCNLGEDGAFASNGIDAAGAHGCVAHQRIDLESAAYVVLAAVSLHTILAYRVDACPQVMVDRVVRYSRGVPIRAASGTPVVRRALEFRRPRLGGVR